MTQVTYNSASGLVTKDLASAGFRDVDSAVSYRIVACTTGPEKAGKTFWSMTAPSPVAVISTDTGTESIAKKFLESKKVILAQFASTKELLENTAHEEQKKQWKKMKDAFMRIVEDKRIRTLVWDTAGEGWDLCRLAEFGKLTQVMPHNYTVVNSEFTALIKTAYQRTDLNCIFIHKQKKQYKKGSDGKDGWTGKWDRAGFGDMPYLVDVNLVHYFDREAREFGIEVIDSRLQMVDVVGTQLSGALCTFQELALQLFPGSPEELWA